MLIVCAPLSARTFYKVAFCQIKRYSGILPSLVVLSDKLCNICYRVFYSMYRETKLYVNRRYQRKLVWTLTEKQKLIESILKKYPIPAILIAERDGETGTYEIIDGLQRLQAILSFIETSFPDLDNRYFNVNNFPTAKKNADEGLFEKNETGPYLTPKEISILLDYTLALSVMRNASDAEINDVFDRINTYGHRLSDQERRQAGVQNPFSNMVRTISCILRGDVSHNVLPLTSMPSISIDLPKTKHGYLIQAEEVFWVKQGILRSTDLRDSMDEQCVADIGASIIGGVCLERSKEALDRVYNSDDSESERISNALQIYGDDTFQKEFIFCIDEIIKVCNAGRIETLKSIIFPTRNSNPFPSIFAIVFISFHELLIKENKKISNYSGVKESLRGLGRRGRVEIGQRASSPSERRKNINQVKGLIQQQFIPNDRNPRAFIGNTCLDIDAAIRRSEIELGNYELKQGILTLSNDREIDSTIIKKLVNTIAAIANNGPDSPGGIIIGVADKESDARRIEELDGIKSLKVGNRNVVGIKREAKVLNISLEKYVGIIKEGLKNSALTESIKMSVLSTIDYSNYFDLGIITINILPQKEMAFVGDEVYWRNMDSTEKTQDAKRIAILARRF